MLSDTLGISTLVDSINSAKPPGATESTVLGPFFTEDAHDSEQQLVDSLRWTFLLIRSSFPEEKGESIASEGKGDYMFVEGVVADLRGNPIPNATIDTWETDGNGSYDTQVRAIIHVYVDFGLISLTVRIKRGTRLSRETPLS